MEGAHDPVGDLRSDGMLTVKSPRQDSNLGPAD